MINLMISNMSAKSPLGHLSGSATMISERPLGGKTKIKNKSLVYKIKIKKLKK
jgi:hypothetical protein